MRWSHWINFPLILAMVWSGILIYWANQAYVEIPDSLAQRLRIEFRLAEGMGWHFFLMWPFIINGILFLAYLAWSGEWRDLRIHRSTFREAIAVALHDIGIRKGDLPPQDGKFNAAQRIAYVGVFVLAAGSTITGLAIYKPVQLGWLTQALGGYRAARLEHFVFMSLIVLFFFIHIAQVLRAGWNNFRAMVAGYEIKKSELD